MKMCLKLILLIVLNLQIIGSLGLKILIYHTAFSPSQIGFSGILSDVLVNDGNHTVDKIIMEFNPTTGNGSKNIRNVYRIGFKDPKDNPFMKLHHISKPFEEEQFKNDYFIESLRKLCSVLVEQELLISTLRAEKYDIYITSVYDACSYGFFHLLEIPVIVGFSPTAPDRGMLSIFGIPSPPSYIPSPMNPVVQGSNFSLSSRLKELKDFLLNSFNFNEYRVQAQNIFNSKFSKGTNSFPDLRTIAAQMTYLFLNTNELLDFGRPISAKIKYIGGISTGEVSEQPYSNEIQKVVSKPSRGIIMLSFGSLLKTNQIPPETLLSIMEGFSRFPAYTILFRFTIESFDAYAKEWNSIGNPSNSSPGKNYSKIFRSIADLLDRCKHVYRFMWLPQKKLLDDPRLKVFITHMGMNSYMEVAKAGVPIIAIPVFIDQFYNTGCATRKNRIGVYLDKSRITADNFEASVRKVLENPVYSNNAKLLSRMLSKSLTDPKRIFLEYVEYAAEFPELSEALQLEAVRIHPIQYLCLDIIFGAITIASVGLLVAIYFIKQIKSWIQNNKKPSRYRKGDKSN